MHSSLQKEKRETGRRKGPRYIYYVTLHPEEELAVRF